MNNKHDTDEGASAGNLAADVAGLIDAVFGVGAAMARASAEVTARGGEVSPPKPGSAPFSVMIHYGLATASNLISLVTSVAGAAAGTVTVKPGAKAPAGTVPRVRPGAKLRVPLSVENPSDRPMTGLSPQLRRLHFNGMEVSDAIPAAAVQFTPEMFTVSPRDFEKLTVLVAVPEGAAAGRYDLILALGPSEPELPLSFDVVTISAN